MKNISRAIWGIILIILGFIIAVNSLGIARIDIFFKGWWTLFIIVPSLISIIDGNNKKDSFIGLIIGIALLLAAQGFISFGMILKLIFPFILIVIGISVLYDGLFEKEIREKVNSVKSDEIDYITAVFSEEKRTIDYKFKSANVEAIFGSVKVDLTDAQLSSETTLKMNAIFGGVTLVVPENVKVKIKSTNIFGGVEKKDTESSKKKSAEKTIFIESFTMFGGITIK